MVCRHARLVHLRRETASALFVSLDSRKIVAAGFATGCSDQWKRQSNPHAGFGASDARSLFALHVGPALSWETWRVSLATLTCIFTARAQTGRARAFDRDTAELSVGDRISKSQLGDRRSVKIDNRFLEAPQSGLCECRCASG